MFIYLKPIAIDRIGRDIFSDHMPYSFFFLLTAGISLRMLIFKINFINLVNDRVYVHIQISFYQVA